jgi:DNA (cytosine-5)-methyltransferase 1
MRNSYITVTDQFCGAGGSSQGVREFSHSIGGGVEVKMALNHWKLAIETHNTNFPDTDHDCTDISACDPRRYPTTDVLITSPECTVHSPAGGRRRKNLAQMDCFTPYQAKPEEDRSRATMWDVPRFAEYHNYNIIIVENVVEARDWILFPTWLQAMHNLGYKHRACYFNSMHFQPTPQSRDRMYIVFWKKGNPEPDLALRPKAFCQKCVKDVESFQWWKKSDKKWGKYGQQYLYRCSECNDHVEPYYYAAFNIIDWTIPGRPVNVAVRSENTLRRITYGLEKYGHELFMVNIGYSSGVDCRVRNFTDPLTTVVGTVKHALIAPYFINTDHPAGKDNIACRNSTGPMRTQTTAHTTGIVMPFICELNRTGKARAIDQPLSTVLAGGNHHAIVQAPVLVENNGQSNAKSITSPVPCITTQTKHGIINPEAAGAFLNYYNGGSDVVSGMKDPVRTITTVDRAGLTMFKKPTLEDCTYRTIRPHEVKAAMAFDKDYIVLGNSKDQVKQLGNAVTPPAMKFLIERTVATLK